jgi:hypothetical protein
MASGYRLSPIKEARTGSPLTGMYNGLGLSILTLMFT